jgi:hypothetical protein
LPDDVAAQDLDHGLRVQLKSLSKENAEAVARHLVMVGRLVEDDPEAAHRHAVAAAQRAGRIAVVREAVGITAYQTGDFARALRELRTYRRISGRDDEIALMVDSERGMGRPDRALELGRSVKRETLPQAAQVSLAIAMSGARLDLGEVQEARSELEIRQLDPAKVFDYSPELFEAYAEVLEELGDPDAAAWRRRAAVARSALYTASADAAEETIIVTDEPAEPAESAGSAELPALAEPVESAGPTQSAGPAASAGPAESQELGEPAETARERTEES